MKLRHCACIVAMLLLKVSSTSCKQNGSLSFVIDDTGSMGEEIEQIKEEVDGIMNFILNNKASQIQDIVLVTFNDPSVELLQKTRSREKLKISLGHVHAHGGGGDCVEMALTGLKLALENSLRQSYIYLFTDAPPKDMYLAEEVKNMAQDSGSQVVFIVTTGGYCYNRVDGFKSYQDIAFATFGQVFFLSDKDEVTKILPYVKETTSGDRSVILSKEIRANEETAVSFDVDDQTEHVIVSASGRDVSLTIRGPRHWPEQITWINNAKVAKISYPSPGRYVAVVRGSTKTTVMVVARTDFTFQHSFSQARPQRAWSEPETTPTAGTNYYMSVSVSDQRKPIRSVTVDSVLILNMDQKLIARLPLQWVSGDFYTTDLFQPPQSMFLIAVNGTTKSGNPIRRISKTPIKPQKRRFSPIPKIEPIPSSVTYNSDLWLTCTVQAHPEPTIAWKDEHGQAIVPRESPVASSSDVYTSHVKVHVTRGHTYTCEASNYKGTRADSVSVAVASPFTVPDRRDNTIRVNYEKKVILNCNIESSFPIETRWYRVVGNHKSYMHAAKEHTIMKMEKELEGTYTCQAHLKEDKDMTRTLEYIVKINEEAPQIEKLPATVEVRENTSVTFKCNIAKGYPQPKITMGFIRRGSDKPGQVLKSGDSLNIKRASLADSGIYRCVAVNAAGVDERLTELVVTAPPKITLLTNEKHVASQKLAYYSKLHLTCTVTAWPEPNIVWKNGKGNAIATHGVVKSYAYEYTSRLRVDHAKRSEKYRCEAINNQGSSYDSVEVNVLSPFTVAHNDFRNVSYGKPAVLKCQINSLHKMRITWSRAAAGASERHEPVVASDEFSLSADGKELTINKMDLHLQGRYSCKAILQEDRNMEENHYTDIKINDLAPPKITLLTNEEHVASQKLAYNSKLHLTCTATACPEPKIVWKNGKGNAIATHGVVKISAYEYTSRLTVDHAKRSEKYRCEAINNQGSSYDSVEVTVLSPFTVAHNDFRNVSYGKPAVLKCQINSLHKMRITWSRAAAGASERHEPVVASDEFSLSADGKELTINKMDLHLQGRYSCKAVLQEDGNMEENHYTDIKINDLAPPKITLLTNEEHVASQKLAYNSKLHLTCTATACPEPKIVWKNGKGNAIATHGVVKSSAYEYTSRLTVDHAKRSEKYRCEAINNQGSSYDSVEVTVLSPFTVAHNDFRNVSYGKPAVLKCQINSLHKMRITWSRAAAGASERHEPVVASDEFSLSADGKELTINKMDLHLQGRYSCKAVLQEDGNMEENHYTDIKINDLAPPRILRQQHVLEVKETTPVLLMCKVLSGNPKPEIIWSFKSKDSKKTLAESSETLQIERARFDDAGTYECVAKNVIGQDKKETKLIVNGPPRIDKSGSNTKHTAVEGDVALRLPCDIVGYPEPNIVWTVDGSEIHPDEHYAIENGALLILNPIEDDSNKKYACNAENDLGRDERSFEINVSPTLGDFGNLTHVYILKGRSERLNCPQSKSDKVKWYKEGIHLNITGPSLTIVNAAMLHDGNYSCRASGRRLRATTHSFVVDVGHAPRFRNEAPATIDWDGEQILDCEAEYKPVAEVAWEHDGEPLPTTATSTDVAGWGNYTCTLRNQHGSAQRSFYVYSSKCIIKKGITTAANAPLLLTADPRPAWPTFEFKPNYLVVKSKQRLHLSCPDRPGDANSFRTLLGKSEIVATCDHEDKFTVDGAVYTFEDLFQCNSQVSPVIHRTGETCKNENTELIKVGFHVNSFIEVYEVCFDNIKKVPLYSEIKMTTTPEYGGVEAAEWRNYPEISEAEGEYDCDARSSCCYTKSQLANARDARSRPARAATFINRLNSVPVWRACDNDTRVSWQDVEDFFRSQSSDSESVSVWTGASHFSSTNGLMVPRFLWKMARFSPTYSMVLVHVNAPRAAAADVLCPPAYCPEPETHWGESKSSTYTYCCDLHDFYKAFDYPEHAFI